MKNKVFACVIVLMLAAYGHGQGATVYNFNVVIDYSGISDNSDKIQGLLFDISGDEGIDWVFGGFTSPYDSGQWFFDSTGIIDLELYSNNYLPLNTGTIFTLISPNDLPLFITVTDLFDYNNNDFPSDRFSASLNPVPIPPAVLLLGSGLIGMMILRRRKC